jgi:hypothetical protein
MIMTASEIAVIIVPVATAIGTLIPVIKSVVSIRTYFKKFEKKLDLNSRDIQRLVLHDEHLPMEERLSAGQRYIDLGGNGATRAYYEKLVEEYKKKLEV